MVICLSFIGMTYEEVKEYEKEMQSKTNEKVLGNKGDSSTETE